MKPTREPPEISPVLSVGEVARRSGVPVSSLHFYENRGLISSVRTPGNQRRYARDPLQIADLASSANPLTWTGSF